MCTQLLSPQIQLALKAFKDTADIEVDITECVYTERQFVEVCVCTKLMLYYCVPSVFVCMYIPTYLHVFLIVLPYIHIRTYAHTCVSTIQLVWDYYERVRENDSDMFDPLVEHLTEYGQGRKLLVMQKQYRYVRMCMCTYIHT